MTRFARAWLFTLAFGFLGCGGGATEGSGDTAELTSGAEARAQGNPLFLFTVHQGDRLVGHLHGSVHMLRPEDAAPAEPVARAYEESDALVVELDVTRLDSAAMQGLVQSLGMFPEGDDLEKHLAPELFQAARDKAIALGLPEPVIRQFRPWFLGITLAVTMFQAAGYSPNSGVDHVFLVRAHEAEPPVPVRELETAEGQLRAMASMSEEAQSLMLQETLETGTEHLDELFDAWKSGDTKALADLTFEDLDEDPAFRPFYEAFFFARNARMAEKLEGFFAEDRRHFVVIGAAHLVGEGSVPALLRERGFTVEQVYE